MEDLFQVNRGFTEGNRGDEGNRKGILTAGGGGNEADRGCPQPQRFQKQSRFGELNDSARFFVLRLRTAVVRLICAFCCCFFAAHVCSAAPKKVKPAKIKISGY